MYWLEGKDGSFVWEFIRPTWRFGVSLEIDPSESGWFFVHIGGSKPIVKSGRIGKVVHNGLYRLFRPDEKSYKP